MKKLYLINIWYALTHYCLRDASYVSIVLVTIVQVVSPFVKYSDCVVIVRVTLQEVKHKPAIMQAAKHKRINNFRIVVTI